MQVLFKLIVIYELNKESQNGYQIIKQIGIHYGKKPSAGTIFPFLDRLEKEDLISVKKDERTNIYSLTKKGKDIYKEIIFGKEEIILSLFELYRFLTQTDALYDDIRNKINSLSEKSSSMKQLKNLSTLKAISFKTICSENFSEHEKSFENIIKKTIFDIEKINDMCCLKKISLKNKNRNNKHEL